MANYFKHWLEDVIIIVISIGILSFLPNYIKLSNEPGTLALIASILVYLVPIVLLLVVLFMLVLDAYNEVRKLRYSNISFGEGKNRYYGHR
jgi:uncharacterized membrane protein YesL